MIAWKFKPWRTAGAAAALTLAACGGEGGGEKGPAAEGGESAAMAGGEAGEAAIGEGGGEHGEAGVASAYQGVSGDQRTALRLQQLKGFLMAASVVTEGDRPEDASLLVQQGLLEVYDPAAEQFGALDVTAVRAASDGAGVSRSSVAQRLQAGEAAIDAARGALEVDHADLAVRMTDISAGLYQNVIQSDFVDPIEYQHSMGAARAARDALVSGEAVLRTRNAHAYDEGLTELNRLVDMWPSPAAPERPTPYRDVLAQTSRVRLALSPFL